MLLQVEDDETESVSFVPLIWTAQTICMSKAKADLQSRQGRILRISKLLFFLSISVSCCAPARSDEDLAGYTEVGETLPKKGRKGARPVGYSTLR